MFKKPSSRARGLRAVSATVFGVAMLAGLVVLGGRAISAQDRYAVQVPDGLAFSEFRGYEKWQTIGVSHAGNLIEVILGDPAMIAAYEAGIPGNGQRFPDGVRMAKIHWNTKMNAEGFPIVVTDTLHDVDFMMKDSKRFADTGAWGYAEFDYDAASDSFKPLGRGANCGYACHMAAAAKDYVFTAFPKR